MVSTIKHIARGTGLACFCIAALLDPGHGKAMMELCLIGLVLTFICFYHDQVELKRDEYEERRIRP